MPANDHQEEGGTVLSCTNHMNSELQSTHNNAAATFEPKKKGPDPDGKATRSSWQAEHLFPDRKGPPAPGHRAM